jgi:hypothetical protein
LTMPYDRPFAFVHLGTGNSKEPAPAPVASMLWEASKAFEAFTGKGFLVALPVVSPGQMGSSLGRYVPLAIYDAQGVAKWVHPLAKEAGLISSEIPEHQRYRSRTQPPSLDMQAIADLYRETHLGGALKGRCIQHLTGQLVEAGTTFEDARNQAAAAWDAYLATAQAKPASPPTSPEASEMATIAANLSAKGVPLDELQSYSVQRFATQLVNLKQLSPQEAEIQAQHAWAAYQASLADHSAAKSTPNPPQPLPKPQHPDTVKPSASQPSVQAPAQAPAQAPSSSRSGTLFSKRVVPVSGRPMPASRGNPASSNTPVSLEQTRSRR